MKNRILYHKIIDRLPLGKAIIILGPRQVGKTTLVDQVKEQFDGKSISFNCDDLDVVRMFQDKTSTQLKNIIGNAELVIFDEAQRIKDIGITLKLIIDNLKDKKVIVTGSSSLEMSNQINEPLTGRKFELNLFPFSFQELMDSGSYLDETRLLEQRLIFGSYPDIVNNPTQAIELLKNLYNSYLYKDIFNYQDIRKPEIITRLLQALALQVGSEVSYNEVAQLIGADPETVVRYIDLLEKTYVLFRLSSLSRNSRNEIKKSRKIYFWDNGIRNAIISNFNSLDIRNDKGALFENYLISERQKFLKYNLYFADSYFWRTTQQQEIDYLEESNGKLNAFEFKWQDSKKYKLPPIFSQSYDVNEFTLVDKNNYTDFLTQFKGDIIK